jgi:hypothetical protein
MIPDGKASTDQIVLAQPGLIPQFLRSVEGSQIDVLMVQQSLWITSLIIFMLISCKTSLLMKLS